MTEVNIFFSLAAGLALLMSYVPYATDILKNKVQPARSARLMFVVLLLIALFQQHTLGSGWVLAVTVGELVGSIAIFSLAMKYGVGGLKKLDMACYSLLFLTILIWITTDNALVALHATIMTDLIAFTPTLLKTWHKPTSETPLFFLVGFIAPLIGLIALTNYNYGIIAFPLYLAFINGLEVILIYRKSIPATTRLI